MLGKTASFFQPEEANRLEQPQRSHRIDIGGILGALEAHRNMALGAEVVNLVRLDLGKDTGEVRTVGQIAVMQLQPWIAGVRIFVDVVNSLGVEH